uniref:Uncharacterized protein n=1 Tax=Rhizophora mucronata TaxID=61149 RepID=A0A2P2J3Y2_RHIMU
MILVQKNIYS